MVRAATFNLEDLTRPLVTHPALFVTEIAALTGATRPELERALADLAEGLLVVSHHPADHHLQGDFRIVALREVDHGRAPAERRAADHWAAFLRQVAATHRCV